MQEQQSEQSSEIMKCGKTYPGVDNGGFICITCEAQTYLDYHDKCVTAENKETWFKFAFMVQRWDGKIGFPGGRIEVDKETVKFGTIRELAEEAGVTGISQADLQDLLVQKTKTGSVVHTFHVHLGKMSVHDMRAMLVTAACAEHAVVEGTAIWVHLNDYGRDKGINNLLKLGALASSVKEALEAVCEKLNSK